MIRSGLVVSTTWTIDRHIFSTKSWNGHLWADSNVNNFALFGMVRHPPGAMPQSMGHQLGGSKYPLVASELNMAHPAFGVQNRFDALT